MRILKAGGLYFALVFAAGFVLGTFRVLLLVPRFGARTAELLEAPDMLAVTIFAARWVVRRLALPPRVVALGLLLSAELTIVLALRGLTIQEYLAARDPVAGTVYIIMLGIFAAMPFFVARRRALPPLSQPRMGPSPPSTPKCFSGRGNSLLRFIFRGSDSHSIRTLCGLGYAQKSFSRSLGKLAHRGTVRPF